MKILITGGTGLIGHFLAKELLRAGHTLTLLHRRDALPQAIASPLDGVEWIQGSLNDVHTVAEVLEGKDAVIHAAGQVSFAPRDFPQLWQANVEATALLADTARELGIRKFVHISSVSALGKGKHQALLDESATWEPTSKVGQYGYTKHMGEREVWRAMAEGLQATIISPAVVLGPGPEVRSSLKLLKYIQKGGRWSFPGSFSYIDIRDLAHLITLMLEGDYAGQRYIASASQVTYASFFSQWARHLNQRPPSRQIPIQLLSALVPIEKARTQILGGRPAVTREMVDSLKNPVAYANDKSLLLPDFQYHRLEDTLAWLAQACQ